MKFHALFVIFEKHQNLKLSSAAIYGLIHLKHHVSFFVNIKGDIEL